MILDGNLALLTAPNFSCKNVETILSYLAFRLDQFQVKLQRVAQQQQVFRRGQPDCEILGFIGPNLLYRYFADLPQRLRCHRFMLLAAGGIALLDDEVSAVIEQQGAVQDAVEGFRVEVGALGGRPVVVVPQEKVLAGMVEEAALNTLPRQDAQAKGGQQLLLPVLLDHHVLVGPGYSIGNRLPPWSVGYQVNDVRILCFHICPVPIDDFRSQATWAGIRCG